MHNCPECGSACHCGGDIDDILLENTREEMRCTCCPAGGRDEDDYLDGADLRDQRAAQGLGVETPEDSPSLPDDPMEGV